MAIEASMVVVAVAAGGGATTGGVVAAVFTLIELHTGAIHRNRMIAKSKRIIENPPLGLRNLNGSSPVLSIRSKILANHSCKGFGRVFIAWAR